MNDEKFDPSKPIIISNGGGPRTDEGKQISSRNSMKHGCCSTETLILKTENMEDYKSLESTWFRAYEPQTEADKHLIKELINADWFLQRATRTVAEVEAQILETTPNPLDWTEQQHRNFNRFLRYQTTRSNTVNRCRKAVEDYRKKRAQEKADARQIAERAEAKKAAAAKRVQPKTEISWAEKLQSMRDQAIALGFRPPDGPNPALNR
jgi:hypothetical protein